MFENIIKNVHNRHPLIHCITNYVSINDCANIVLACGGAPIMAEDINEVSQITSICQGLEEQRAKKAQRRESKTAAYGIR